MELTDEKIASMSIEELDELEKIVDLQIEQSLRLAPAQGYVPNGEVEKYVKAVGEGQYKIFLLSAANGVGKSCSAVVTLCNIIYGKQNEWFGGELFEKWPYPKTFWYVSTPSNLIDNIIGDQEGKNVLFNQWFPKGRFTLRKGNYAHFSSFQSDNGWSGTFKSFDMETKMFEGPTIGCIEANERVLMADGTWKKIIDIQVGDKVVGYGHSLAKEPGRYKPQFKALPKGQQIDIVVAKIVHLKRELKKIVCVGNTSVRCTPDHRFFIRGKGWVEAQNINKGDRIAAPAQNFSQAPTIEEWQAFMLGVLIGDGMLRGKQPHLTCFNERLLSEIRSILPDNFYLRAKERSQFLISSQTSGKNELTSWLRDIGIWGKLSHDKFIPDIIFRQPNDLKQKFVSGLYATDGWFSGRNIGYASTSHKLCTDLVLLLKSLGIAANIYPKKSQKVGKWRDQTFVLISRRRDILRFIETIKVPCKQEFIDKVYARATTVKRGQENYATRSDSRNMSKDRKWLYVKSVDDDGVSDVVDIQTEPHNNFVVNNLLAHNCIVLDEPPPEAIFDACIARLRQGGILIMPMTPLADAAWIFDRLVEKAGDVTGRIFMMYADIEAACIEHGVRGHLKHEHIADMMSLWKEEEIEARAHGKPTHLKGRIYKNFNSILHRHNKEPHEFPQNEYRIFNVVDPHDARPPFINWFAVDKYENAWAIEEFPSMPEFKPFEEIGTNWNLTTGEVCARIKDIEKLNGWDPRQIVRIMDPNFGRRKEHDTGKRTYQIWGDHGKKLGWPLRYKTNVVDDLKSGHDLVREFIKPNADGHVRYKVGENCDNTWRHLNRYAYAWREGKGAEKHGMGEKVAQKYKDGADPTRYFMMFFKGPRKIEKPKEDEVPEHYAMYGYRPTLAGQRVKDWRDPFNV